MRGWTDAKIKAGFEQFYAEHKRLPRAHEIDELSYLPSSRAIQKRFGGLAALRERLGYDEVHFGQGIHRSEIAHAVGKRGRQLEIDVEQKLVELFGERSVHTEKIFYGKHRVDFYVFTQSGNFGVDVFYPSTVRTMQNNVNIKMKKYQYYTEPLYFVVANEEITQTQLNQYAQNRRNPFTENIKLLTLKNFMKEIKVYKAYN